MNIAGIRITSGLEHYSVDDIEAEREGWQKAVDALTAERDRLAGSLAACGVIAGCDDAESFDKWCLPNDNPYSTDSSRAVTRMRQELTAVLAERDRLRRDGERYRWLRDRWFIAGEAFPDELHEGAVTTSHFDEAIDSALAAQGDGK